MDLIGVTTIRTPRTRAEIALGPRDRAIGGGTWLYSETQSGFDTIVDLTGLDWPEVTETDDALTLAATCRLRTVHALGERFPLFAQCTEALLASWKVWNVATIGGNLCFGVPASAMVSLVTALDATLVTWRGDDERRIRAADWILAPQTTALEPGEILRAIEFPRHALEARTAFRKIALADLGRSGAVTIARTDTDGAFVLSVTAATAHPWVFRWQAAPTDAQLTEALDAVDDWYADAHGSPDWREHMTRRFAIEVAEELR